jgi:hypothetical protein
MSDLTELPVYRQQESGVDRPYALTKRLGAAAVQEIVRVYEAGTAAAELAEPYGVSPTGLTNLLHSQGAAVRRPRGLGAADVDMARRLYAEGGCCGRSGRSSGSAGMRAASAAPTTARDAQ